MYTHRAICGKSMGRMRYPHKMSAVYFNATTAILSAILAFLILDSPYTWLLLYSICTSIVTVIVFIFKNHLFQTQDSGEHTSTWKALLIFLVFVACLFLPLLLAGILDPYIWFILLVSFTSGFSTSEVIFYLYTR